MSAVPPNGLAADGNAIGIYIRSLFAYADEGSFASLRGFFDLRDGTFRIRPVRIGPDLDTLASEAVRFATECARHDEPVVCAPPVATFSNGKQAREADLQNGLALSVECDQAPTAARAKLEGLFGSATIVVASGGEWTDPQTGERQPKLHLHWRLNEPTRDSNSHKLLKQARIIATRLVGGDATNQPTVHPIRCAGSWHRKAIPRLATIEALTNNEIGLADALERLQEAAAAAGREMPREDAPEHPQGTGEERDTAELVKAILAASDYHAPLTALAMRLLKGGTADAQVVLLLRAFMLAVPIEIRDAKGGTEQTGRWQARFDDIPRAVRTARQKLDSDNKRTSPERLRLLSVADCVAAKPRRYVIKGIIARGDLVLIIGAPGAGKSALAPYLAYAVAQGREAFSRRVRPGKVLYVTAEDAHGMRGRIHALKLRHGGASDFFVVDGVTDLLNADGQAGELQALVEREGPAIVVIDTVAAAFPGLEENYSSEMGKVIKLARAIARGDGDTPGPAVILLHHVPKGGDTSRGHTNLPADADVQLLLTPDKDSGTVAVALPKNRNGPSYSVRLAFGIEPVCIGQDEDGDEITAPVAVECEADTVRRADRLKPTEHTARGILADLLVEHGSSLPHGPGFAEGLRGVRFEDWRGACETRHLSAAEEAKDRGKVFRRAWEGLRAKGIAAACDGWVWLAHPECARL